MHFRLSSFHLIKPYRCMQQFVPKHEKINLYDITVLQNFLTINKNIVVLTGAGVSTESGLPDYRSKDVGLYERTQHRPVQYKDFVNKPEVRRRYWARNFVAWKTFSSRKPNETHLTLAKWEKQGIIDCIVTQNVDRLHQKAGSMNVVELHGSSYVVKCLGCAERYSRQELQRDFALANPKFQAVSGEIRPDADIELEASLADSFNVVDCKKCRGVLKPDVVFFGENVSKDLVTAVYERIENSGALLVIGSSLEVYSGYRFALHAYDYNKPIGIVNIGPTRADSLATFKISKCCGELLPRIVCSRC